MVLDYHCWLPLPCGWDTIAEPCWLNEACCFVFRHCRGSWLGRSFVLLLSHEHPSCQIFLSQACAAILPWTMSSFDLLLHAALHLTWSWPWTFNERLSGKVVFVSQSSLWVINKTVLQHVRRSCPGRKPKGPFPFNSFGCKLNYYLRGLRMVGVSRRLQSIQLLYFLFFLFTFSLFFVSSLSSDFLLLLK